MRRGVGARAKSRGGGGGASSETEWCSRGRHTHTYTTVTTSWRLRARALEPGEAERVTWSPKGLRMLSIPDALQPEAPALPLFLSARCITPPVRRSQVRARRRWGRPTCPHSHTRPPASRSGSMRSSGSTAASSSAPSAAPSTPALRQLSMRPARLCALSSTQRCTCWGPAAQRRQPLRPPASSLSTPSSRSSEWSARGRRARPVAPPWRCAATGPGASGGDPEPGNGSVALAEAADPAKRVTQGASTDLAVIFARLGKVGRGASPPRQGRPGRAA